MSKKFQFLAAMAVVGLGLGGTAQAQGVFTVSPSALPGSGTIANFSADLVHGNSTELLTIGGGGTTFTGSGILTLSSFALNQNNIPAGISGLNLGIEPQGYNLYATFSLSGTLASGPGNLLPGSTYNLTSLNVVLFADPLENGVVTPASSSGAGTTPSMSNTADDIQLALATLQTGTAGIDILGGAFLNSIETFALCTGAGTASVGGTAVAGPGCLNGTGNSFFLSPKPFYELAFDAFNNTTQGVSRNGNLVAINQAVGDVDFNTIPEPATLAMFGMGLLGLGAALRRRRARG